MSMDCYGAVACIQRVRKVVHPAQCKGDHVDVAGYEESNKLVALLIALALVLNLGYKLIVTAM